MTNSPWTPPKAAELRRLWDQIPELYCGEIGRKLGVSKNAVIGKANRLHLEPRRRSAQRQRPCR